ncbi:glycosyltransferase [Marinobacter sp. DUT-3]|uniref:glycosyltransferase n=1 Tax=Marinobacter sp. DUT-3 TaxID=3412036 RepID=UPI003D16D43D
MTENLPFVSVLIPAKNEQRDIPDCLNSLLQQDYPKDLYEIILIDNGSMDRTVEIARKYNVSILDASNLSIGGVRNFGAKNAIGSIYAYIDADCVAGKSWIRSGVELLNESKKLGAVGGQFSVRDNASWIESFWALPQEYVAEVRNVGILATGSFFVKKEVFDLVEGFEEDICAGEDTDISKRIINAGYEIGVSSRLTVIHLGYPRTISSFFKRQVWQSSDYLKTKKNGVDWVFLLVNFFMLCLVFILISSLFLELKVTLQLISVAMSMPLLLTIKRVVKSSAPKYDIKMWFGSYFLNFLYCLARTTGLLKSYFRLIKSR